MVPQFFTELLFHLSEDVDNVIGKSAHVKDVLEGIYVDIIATSAIKS